MTTVVIPTRNEPGIGALVRPIVRAGWDVIVADDSSDHTAELAIAAGAKVVYPAPGLGPAYLGAWDRIDADEWVWHFDAGGSWRLVDLFDMDADADVLIGSRFAPGGAHCGPRARQHLSRSASFVSNQLRWGPKVADWTSGFRRYSPRARALLSKHSFVASGHAWQIEALSVCLTAGLSVGEIGVTYQSSSSSLDFGRMVEALKVWGHMLWQ